MTDLWLAPDLGFPDHTSGTPPSGAMSHTGIGLFTPAPASGTPSFFSGVVLVTDGPGAVHVVKPGTTGTIFALWVAGETQPRLRFRPNSSTGLEFGRGGTAPPDASIFYVLGLAPTTAITGATNASPIVITSTAHGLTTGDRATIASVGGNTAANGSWAVVVTDANTFSLTGSTGNAAYTSGGTAAKEKPTLRTSSGLTSGGALVVAATDGSGYLQLNEQTTAPLSASNAAQLYTDDSSTVTQLRARFPSNDRVLMRDVARPAYTLGTYTTDRAVSNSATILLGELGDVLSTLIQDLKDTGTLG